MVKPLYGVSLLQGNIMGYWEDQKTKHKKYLKETFGEEDWEYPDRGAGTISNIVEAMAYGNMDASDKSSFVDYPGGAFGRYTNVGLNELLNLFARGDEGRDMPFEKKAMRPSLATSYVSKKDIESAKDYQLRSITEMLAPQVVGQDNTKVIEVFGDKSQSSDNVRGFLKALIGNR